VTRDTPAETILKRFGITEPGEIDLEAVAWRMGARVRYRPLDRCEARIIGAGDRAVITVNARSSRRRKRFSIGHELGHWHHDRGRVLFCAADDIGRAAPDHLGPERIADRFASRLLMPEYLLRPVAGAHKRITFEAVHAIGEVFDTSRTATAIRLVEGNYFIGCLVCHSPQGRKWFTRSPDVPDRWFPARIWPMTASPLACSLPARRTTGSQGASARRLGSTTGKLSVTKCMNRRSESRMTRS
jgi:hypothetical protein